MRVLISHPVGERLTLPLGYHHIIQGIIYHSIDNSRGYSNFLHNEGYRYQERTFRMFTFSLLKGSYQIKDKTITFSDSVSFYVSSPDTFFLRILTDELQNNGITYGDRHFEQVEVSLSDQTVETEDINIRMLSPICVYETDFVSKKSFFYAPEDERFSKAINDNFKRKYMAYCGVTPKSDISVMPVNVTNKDKYVTIYKNFYINGWKGEYQLQGERKYLDFLLQVGIGSKNAQGFGLFEIM